MPLPLSVERFLKRSQPPFQSLLLIESGPRCLTEQVLPFFYTTKNVAHLDVLTCYNSPPDAFDFDRGVVYSVHDPDARQNRGAFIRKLASGPYTVIGLLCTGSPILLKWKWMLAMLSCARLVVVNEEAHYFTLDVWNLDSAGRMVLQRLNPFADYTRESLAALILTGLAGLFFAPFTLTYLLLNTAALHLRRRQRLRARKLLPS